MTLVTAVLLVAPTGCGALGNRQTVTQEQARELLNRAVELTAAGRVDELCSISQSEASTCADTLETAGGIAPTGTTADVRPMILCTTPVGDDGPLRGGLILVLLGNDRVGDEYLTEFVVFDDGEEVGVLDPVYWSGLAIDSYDSDTVAWRFDSSSQACAQGGPPSAGPTDPAGPADPSGPVPVDEPS